MGKITIKCMGINEEVEAGITAFDFLKNFKVKPAHSVMLCKIDGRLRELSYKLTCDCKLEWVTVAQKSGMKTYERGITLVFLKALYKERQLSGLVRATIEYGLGRAVYCKLTGCVPDEAMVARIKERMKGYVDENLPIIKSTMSTDAAKALFKSYGMTDKELLFKFRRSSSTNVYDIDGFTDYFYGYMPVETGSLSVFDVQLYHEGLLLLFPSEKDTNRIGTGDKREKLFRTLEESGEHASILGVENVGSLNEQISRGNISDLILLSEAMQEKKIAEIAEMVKASGDKRFVMIAGPSSSGKTTFSHRLSIQLRLVGFTPHPVALDNYYKNREEAPRDEEGNLDFECLEALDVKLFNENMTALLKGEEVEIPSFNFKTGKREYKGDKLKLGTNDILVIEGIHGLNDALSYSLPTSSKFKIYISALTQLNIDEHNRIPTTDGRLLRRIVRDARTRNTSAKDTIAMWPSVRRGEENYIFPYQEEADVMFNSAHLYELAVIKQYAEPLLFGIERDCPEYEEAKRLLKFLDYFLGVSSENIPNNSIVREFIGGSCFNV
ncbi:MAG: nucleoside kinase [Lachnospiraceae bacterium]